MADVISETFLLTVPGVNDLDDFVARPEAYLVSTREEPRRAAQIGHDRAAHNPSGGEGLVGFAHHGVELIAPSMWDDVSGIWATPVEGATFIPGLLDAAIDWFVWEDIHVGGEAGARLARARTLRFTPDR